MKTNLKNQKLTKEEKYIKQLEKEIKLLKEQLILDLRKQEIINNRKDKFINTLLEENRQLQEVNKVLQIKILNY